MGKLIVRILLLGIIGCGGAIGVSPPSPPDPSGCELDNGRVTETECKQRIAPDGGLSQFCIYANGSCRMCEANYCN